MSISAPHDRRSFMAYFSAVGLGSTLLPGVLWGKISGGEEITEATIACAEEMAGLKFDETQRKQMVAALKTQETSLETLHAIKLENGIAPAIIFNPLPLGASVPAGPLGKQAPVRSKVTIPAVPSDLEALAFEPVTVLSELVRTKKVSSLALTQMYLARLKKYDPVLHCVITLTEDRALEQAKAADTEIARGKYRGPLHGIPWGAKDLFAVKGYPTTWGSPPYKDQTFDEDAEIVKRLDAAGAVLVAKLSLGELAQGDLWFGARTRNPWKPDAGSSGSSAGPGSATSAGLVGFAIGTETLGSISSPSTVNGVTGLRPTFGRVPRTGAMALSWTMDKIGPMCRSVEDCALVLDAIQGPDGRDLSVRAAPYKWDATLKPQSLKIGYIKSAFDATERHLTKTFDDAALEVMKRLGVNLIPVEIPDFQYGAMRIILTAEGAAAFDDLTRSGKDKLMTAQDNGSWPNTFRVARFIPAVDYVNANRVRSMAIQKWAELMSTVDVIVCPTNGSQLTATNLTGHPAVILPNGFRDTDNTPVSLTFLGRLYEEAKVLAVAHAYQQATTFHTKHPVVKLG
ncbi:MAG: amidase [Gemmatimonadota bacterium]|nr:amidase [Gemmatimonadota bacterium]